MPNKHISFEVEAFSNDTGSGRRSAIAKVSVEVIDVNDNSPRFKESPQFKENVSTHENLSPFKRLSLVNCFYFA